MSKKPPTTLYSDLTLALYSLRKTQSLEKNKITYPLNISSKFERKITLDAHIVLW